MSKKVKANLKCIVALLLALTMVLGTLLPVFAETSGTGSLSSDMGDDIKIDSVSGDASGSVSDDGISISEDATVSGSDGIKIDKTDDGDIKIKEIDKKSGDDIVLDSHFYTVEWYDADLNLLKSDVRYGTLGDTVYATDEDKEGFDGLVFDEENGLNKLDCKVNIYDSAVIWVMMKEKPKSGPKKAARYLAYPSADDVHMTHYFITDLSDYGGHRLVKENNTYWRQYNLQMYPMFDWSEVESGKFDYEFKEYTCSDPETIWGLNGTLYSGNLYWGTFYFENKTDRLNATHYFGWQASLESLVSSVPAGYAYHSVYWNAKFKEDSVRPKSGFQVNTKITGVVDKEYDGNIINADGISTLNALNTYQNENWKSDLANKNSKYEYVFSGYELSSGSGIISDVNSETSTFSPNNSFSVVTAKYEAKDRTRFKINTILNGEKVDDGVAYGSIGTAFTIYDYVNRNSFDTLSKKYKFLKYELVSGDATILSPNSQSTPCIANSLSPCEINAYFSFDEAITLQVNFIFSGDLTRMHYGSVKSFDNLDTVLLNDYIDSKLFGSFESYVITDGYAVNNGGDSYPIDLKSPFSLQYGSNEVYLKCNVVRKESSTYLYYDYSYVKEAFTKAGLNPNLLGSRYNHYEVFTNTKYLTRSSLKFKSAINGVSNTIPHVSVMGYSFYGGDGSESRYDSNDEWIICYSDGTYGTDDPDKLYFHRIDYWNYRATDYYEIVMWPLVHVDEPHTYVFSTEITNVTTNGTISSNSVSIPVYGKETPDLTLSDYVDDSVFDSDLFDYTFKKYEYKYLSSSGKWYTSNITAFDRVFDCSNDGGYYYSDDPGVYYTSYGGSHGDSSSIKICYDAKPKMNRITVTTNLNGDDLKTSSKSQLFTDLTFKNVGQLIDREALVSSDDNKIIFDGYTLESEDGYLYDLTKEDTDCYCGVHGLGNDIKITANYHIYSESYKLSYDLTGGEGTFPEQDAVDGNYIVTDVVPKKAEYDFIGWSRTKDSETPEYGAGDFIVADNNITLYAVWQKKAIAIEPDAPILAYDTRGGSTIPGTSAVNDTFTVTRRTPALDGKEFVGWTTDPDSVNPLDVDYVGGDVIPGKERMILYALYKDASGSGSGSGDLDNPGGGDDDNPGYPVTKTYTLTYDTKTETNIDPQQSNTGSFTVTRRTPVKEGYVFAGWSTSEDPQSRAEIDYFAGDQFPAVQDITLHAVFVLKADAESYVITYDSKGGSEVKPTKPDAGIFMVTRRVPVKDGFVFAGWSTDEDVSGIDYIAGDKISAIENITLYAVYVKKDVAEKYVLSYDTQGGSAVSDTDPVDGAFMVSRRTPKKDDKVFIGWSKQANDDDIDYIAGDLVLADQDRILYAVYVDQADKPTGKNYTISYNTRGGSEIPSANSINGMFTVTRRVPELPDKTFAGWTLDPDSDKFVDIDYLGGDSFPAQKDIVLYAIYSDIEVTVNTNGGSDVVTNVTQIDNKYIINISITYKVGYILSGWDTDGDGKPDVDPDDPIKTDDPEKPIDAVWELKITPAQYITTKDSTWETQVTWDEQSDIDEDTVRGIKDALIDENGRAYVQIPDTIPERAGYIFLGWDLDNPLISQYVQEQDDVEPYALLAQSVARLMRASAVLEMPVIEVDTKLNARAGEDEAGYYQADDKLYMDELDPVYESGLKFTAMWKPKDGGSGDGDGDGPNPSVSPDPSPSISPEPSESPEPSGKPDSSITPNPSPSVSDNDPDPSVTPDPNESPSPSPGVSDNDPGRPGVSENKPTGTPIPSGTPGGEKPGDKDPGTNNGGDVTPLPDDIIPNPNKPSVSGNVSGNKTPSNPSKPGTGVSNNNTPSPGNNNSGNNNNTGTGGSGNNNSGNSGSNDFGGSNGSSGGNNNAQNAKSTQDQKSDHVVSAVRTADAEYMMFIIIFSVGAIALGYLICRKTGLLAGRDE